MAVEMEAAALYALAETKRRDIVCFALVTNQMGQTGEDFEKGESSGSQTLLHIIGQTIGIWVRMRQTSTPPG
jgi:uridine phosphorylase